MHCRPTELKGLTVRPGQLYALILVFLCGFVIPDVLQAEALAAADDRAPLVVNDDAPPVPLPPAPEELVPVPAATGAEDPAALPKPTSAPEIDAAPTPAAAPVLPAAPAKPSSGGAVLHDPTKPSEEVRPAEPTAPGLQGDSLLPPPSATGPEADNLSSLETSRAVQPLDDVVKRVPPITATTPFEPTKKSDGGPVIMGTDLVPDAAVSSLAPDQLPPDFMDMPEVEATDPWVFGVEVATLYDDNIRLSNTAPQDDFLFVLTASVAWQRGDILRKRNSWARVFYQATGIMFAEESGENNVDHDFQAGGQKRWGKLAVALEGRYRRLSGATPDLGDRVQRDQLAGKITATYDLSGRTFVEGSAGVEAVRYQQSGLADYEEWLADGYVGYELSGRTKIAAGGAVGRLNVAGTDGQDFQRAMVKVTRASTGALGLTAKAGAEFRQTETGNNITPVFNLTADWEPVEDSTKVSASAFRETVASGALAGENYIRTGAALRLAQRFGDRFSAGLEAGYEQLQYSEAAAGGTASGRSDDYFYAKPSLKYEFASKRRAQVFYSFREDDSSVEDFSFSANQWGLSFGLDF
ncbi:MAG: hypothetical protein JWL81_2739 [Verrucomicrobiales bacterium]|nr:hypothetical protein [Verrucomicrobiales bacterium]